MFSILPCTCSRFCQADSTCDRLPRFQVYLEAQDPQVHRIAEACASHLGVMVVTLTSGNLILGTRRPADLSAAASTFTVKAASLPPRALVLCQGG